MSSVQILPKLAPDYTMKIIHSQVIFLVNVNVTSVKVCCRGQLIELSANDPVFKGSNPAAAQVRELIKTTYGQVFS